MNARRYLILILIASFTPSILRAQNVSDGTLHILRPSINAEQDLAELCLEFDHPLDLGDHNHVMAGLRLQSERKAVPLSASNVSIGTTTLCIQGLIHRQEYSLKVSELRGSGGEKLAEAYHLSFTVPDRHPILAFAGESAAAGLTRMKDNEPILRAVNVAHADILLYHITDPQRMVDAFNQRMQTTLAPSETFTFAKDSGQLVWRGKAVLDDSDSLDSANQVVEQPIALHAIPEALAPGLYLIVAIDTAPPAESKKPNSDVAPLTAAQWFLRSDLKLRTLRKNDGFAIETENAITADIAKDTRVFVFGRDGHNLAEGKSDFDGLGFVPLTADKRGEASTVMGLTPAGDVDFIDLTVPDAAGPQDRFTVNGFEAKLTADRTFYGPGNEVFLTLTARTIHGDAVDISGSSVQLLRSDHSLFASFAVSEGRAGMYHTSFAAPPSSGAWIVQWKQSDGRVIAEAPLRISTNPTAPRLSWGVDRPNLGGDGDVKLTIKSLSETSKPVPYVSGQIQLQWLVPDTLEGWSEYHFGKNEKNETTSSPVAAFVTDINGNAILHMTMRAPDDPSPLHTARITLHSDPAAGALDPEPLSLPVRPNNLVVGIKPLAPSGKYAENSIARFDIIALDGEGKRREDFSLKYQVYEEGRSFAWYQAEGRWDYKLMPQRRRIGGGTLEIKASGTNIVRWPVTAGSYTLEITDTNGGVLARFAFDAGWGLLKPLDQQPASLMMTPSSDFVRPGIETKVKFTLDHPAIISAVIADDQIRKIVHSAQPAGDNEITFTPEESWGARIRLSIEAQQKVGDTSSALAGQIELPVKHQPKELDLNIEASSHAPGGQDFKLAVSVGNISGKQPTFVNVLAIPELAYDNEQTRPSSLLVPNIEVGANGKAFAHFGIPQFSGNLRLIVMAANQSQWGQKAAVISVRRAFDSSLVLPSALRLGDHIRLPMSLKNNDAPPGMFHYALNGNTAFVLSASADGKANFSVGEEKSFLLDVQPQEAGEQELRLEVTGPHDFRSVSTWPVGVLTGDAVFVDTTSAEIVARQNWSAPLTKLRGKTKGDDAAYFIGSQPLFDAPQILATLLDTTPFTTGEIASWLETARLWNENIVKAEFLPAQILRARQQKLLRRLLARQNSDGGFPPLAGGESDLANTGEALLALTRAGQVFAQPAIDGAAGWLSQRLANTWFSEEERPARAAAFAALAAADRLDVAALRYFADTSAGKTLPPLAMAQLASALAKSNDRDKAGVWLNSLREQLAKMPPVALPIVAENALFNAQELVPVLSELSDNLTHHASRDPIAQAAFLRSIWAVHSRAGRWRVAINGAERELSDIFVVKPSSKGAPFSLHNPMDRSLWLVENKPVKTPARSSADAVISRHIQQPDGSVVALDQLKRDATYLMVLEGTFSNDKTQNQKLLMHDPVGIGLRPAGCALDSDVSAAENWGWLKNLALTPVESCETNQHGIDAVLTPQGGDVHIWRVAYFVRAAVMGSFILAPATARPLSSTSWVTGGDAHVQIH